MKNILFRADSSSIIGIGHIMRDLVLASQYKGANILFATQELKGNINHKIMSSGYKIIKLKSNNIKEVIKLIDKHHIDMIIIDHYDIDYKKEKQLKTIYPKLKIMVLDDTYLKHHCDILLNHNISCSKKKYTHLVVKNCIIKCGAKYTLIRDEFIKEHSKKRKTKKSKKNIFLALGGSDYNNITLKILKALNKFDDLKVNIITTSSNKNITKLNNYIKKKKRIKLHINTQKMAKLMKNSDIAIISPSVILHEVLYMKIPFIAIKTANNQQDIYKYLLKHNYKALHKFKKRTLINKFKEIINE